MIEQDKVQALDNISEVMTGTNKVIFTDASMKDSRVGAAAVMLDQANGQQRTVQIGLGPASGWTVHTGELIAIHQAREIIEEEVGNKPRQAKCHDKVFTIISDRQAAIRAIANPTSTSGQHIVRRILGQVKVLRERSTKVRLLWIPGHSGNKGNETADQLAKQAVNLESQHDYHRPVSIYKRKIHKKIE